MYIKVSKVLTFIHIGCVAVWCCGTVRDRNATKCSAYNVNEP